MASLSGDCVLLVRIIHCQQFSGWLFLCKKLSLMKNACREIPEMDPSKPGQIKPELTEWLHTSKKKKKLMVHVINDKMKCKMYFACLNMSSDNVVSSDSSCCCLFVCCVSDSFFSLAGQLNCPTSHRPLSLTHTHRYKGQRTVIGSLCVLRLSPCCLLSVSVLGFSMDIGTSCGCDCCFCVIGQTIKP